MTGLRVTLGQWSGPGRKPVNQDFHGAIVPKADMLAAKGIALALADGISSSPVSGIARGSTFSPTARHSSATAAASAAAGRSSG